MNNKLDIVRKAFPPGKLLGKGKEDVLIKDWQKLSYVKWDYKYHIVFVTKCRKRKIHGEIRKKAGPIIRQLCDQKGILLHEGHAMSDRIHIMVNVPLKFSVSNTIGFIKGKSVIRIHREILGINKMIDLSFCARRYCVSTVGLDENMIKNYIKHQDMETMYFRLADRRNDLDLS